MQTIQHIPTTIIMGFLGVGKTSAILSLLEQKPVNEKWAVLVNEFGSVGIDGAIYTSKGIQVKEIAGGCMCCVAGVPLQVAVNNLLKAFRPDRLLIESSGLGHPKKVLDTLRGEHFNKALSLKASICLVDPKNLNDTRYTEHETFIDQIDLSDILIANKTDLADTQSLALFDQLVLGSVPGKILSAKTTQAKLDVKWLELEPSHGTEKIYPSDHLLRNIRHHQGESRDGFQSVGYIYPENSLFDFNCLKNYFLQLLSSEENGIERLKAIVTTDKGAFIFNGVASQLDIENVEQDTVNQVGARLEIIATKLDKQRIKKHVEVCKIIALD